MKFTLKGPFADNIYTMMRKVGYIFQKKNSELNFIRPLDRNGYPRFHLYLEEKPETQELIFNLHLDQKKPSYGGTTAHSGEYEGGLVQKESERIKQILQSTR